MAGNIARAIAVGVNVQNEASRLGTVSAEAQANTFKTFTTCVVKADGSGFVKVVREIGGKRIQLVSVSFEEEAGSNAEITHISARKELTGNDVIESFDSRA